MTKPKISARERHRRLIQSGTISYGGSEGEEVVFVKRKLGGYEVRPLLKRTK